MKKSLLALLVLVSTQGAFARSLMHATLTYDVHVIGSEQLIHTLNVYSNGSVVDRNYDLATGEQTKVTVVANLTSSQMRKIDRLVRRSQPEIMRFERTSARCIVAATTHQRYSAQNATVKLRKGDICDNGFDYNAKPAAKKLVRILNSLHGAAHQRLNMAEVESRVEAVLAGEAE